MNTKTLHKTSHATNYGTNPARLALSRRSRISALLSLVLLPPLSGTLQAEPAHVKTNPVWLYVLGTGTQLGPHGIEGCTQPDYKPALIEKSPAAEFKDACLQNINSILYPGNDDGLNIPEWFAAKRYGVVGTLLAESQHLCANPIPPGDQCGGQSIFAGGGVPLCPPGLKLKNTGTFSNNGYPLNKKADYEEIVIRTFYLNNVDPKQVMSLLKTMLKVKDIFIDEKLNILVVRDSAENVKLIEKLIASYDLSDPEVLLEVEVLEINSNKLLNLGVNYPNTLGVGVKGAGAVASNGSTSLTFDELHKLNPTNGFISFTNPVFVLNLLATDSDSKLLANPRIRVKNHRKAKIHIGDRVPVITTTTNTNSTSESVNYLDVGIKLEVEPSVMVSDEVSIDIGLEVSNIAKEITSKSGTLTYQVGTRNANTTLRLKNGETQVLAGLINDTERSSSNRVR